MTMEYLYLYAHYVKLTMKYCKSTAVWKEDVYLINCD